MGKKYRSGRVSVNVDVSDVIDEIDDSDLLDEVASRGLMAEVEGSPASDDADSLRRCIQQRDWAGAIVYFDRLFPSHPVNTAMAAKAYAEWQLGREKSQ